MTDGAMNRWRVRHLGICIVLADSFRREGLLR